MLFGLAVFDELVSGISSVGAPDIERALGASHAVAMLVLFVVPGFIALVLEPLIFLVADQHPWMLRAGCAAMAAGCAAAAVAPGAWTLALAVGAIGIAIGTCSGIAQARLVGDAGDAKGRVMARWTLLSLGGDVMAPTLLALVPWQTAYGVLAATLVVWTLLLRNVTSPKEPDDPATTSVWAALRDALTDRTLLVWLAATALCDLLDEILIVSASLHVRGALHASRAVQTAMVVAFMAGGAIGLVALERILAKRDERRVLLVCALSCAAVYAAWLAIPNAAASAWVAAVLMLPVGMFAAPLYPLAAARAYALRPEAPGTVLAASHVFTPIGLALPFLIGEIADRAGTHMALAVLAIEPLALALLAGRAGK